MPELPPLNCAGCTKCCQGDVIWLEPGDDPARYQLRAWNGRLALDVKPNGDCVYLGEAGCTIQQDKPQVCKRLDCRTLYTSKTKEQRREHIVKWPAVRAVYAEGRRRMMAVNKETKE